MKIEIFHSYIGLPEGRRKHPSPSPRGSSSGTSCSVTVLASATSSSRRAPSASASRSARPEGHSRAKRRQEPRLVSLEEHMVNLWLTYGWYGMIWYYMVLYGSPTDLTIGCGWLRNTAPPWMVENWKPINSGIDHRFQLVQDFFHPP